jgi:subtilisin family serine protease
VVATEETVAMSQLTALVPGRVPGRVDARLRRWLAALAGVVLAGSMTIAAGASEGATARYLVVFGGTYALDGAYALGGGYALDGVYALGSNYALAHQYALDIVHSAGGTVTDDLSKQIGVMVVESANTAFYALIRNYALVQEVGRDYAWQGINDYALGDGYALDGGAGDAPETVADPLESAQWDMQMIHADAAHAVQGGRPQVQVGVLDSGISGYHVDFQKDGVSNVDCSLGHDSLAILPPGVAVGSPLPCVDNQFHGTHVAGTIAARANGIGITGVAPNVTLVPVKVCDASGFCYASAVIDGITYAGDKKLEVINMSFFVDDDTFQVSTEFKCTTDPTQRAFRSALERALQYARTQGVVAVAALGNEDTDLAHPESGNECDVVPAESSGVIGTAAVGRDSAKASYSNYGTGATDITAPGGDGTTGDCTTTILSTLPADAYGCIQGTSMASPHAAGVAALIVSQFGYLGADGDWKMEPTKVESLMQGTAVDIGLAGYDECYGNGRIDALRAVMKTTTRAYDGSAPFCPEYTE